jgi:hypothetical protein
LPRGSTDERDKIADRLRDLAAPHVPDCLFGARQYPARPFEENLAGVRQLETTRDAVEKLRAQLALKRLDLLAQEWLGNP